MRKTLLVAVACLVGGTAEAQGTARSRVIVRDNVRASVRDSAAMNRATLGVSLGGAAHKRDTLGVFLEAVAENGPAERAGIHEGHRIAFINGVDVRASSADAGDAYLSSVGRHRLMRAMRDVSVGGTVTLRVWNGSGYRDVQVTPGRFTDVYKGQHFGFMEGAVSGAMSFGPAIERMRIEAPMMRGLEMRPSEPGASPRAPRPVIAPTPVRRYTI